MHNENISLNYSSGVVVSKKKESFLHYFINHKMLYFMLVPGLIVLILFKYLPIYGIIVSFMDYIPSRGVFGSKWVGLKHFIAFVNDPYFFRVIRNTFALGFFSITFGFPAPIILALLLNEIKCIRFKKITQTISYMPYFLSTVIVVGLLKDLCSVQDGVINNLFSSAGFQKIEFFSNPQWFRFLYVFSDIWQSVGFGSILYLAAIAGINPELYESAIIDGANRWKQTVHITLPSLVPTIVILFILSIGGILNNDMAKILLMYNPITYETADVVSTYVYRAGIEGASFSYASAVGLFMSVISLVFLITANRISKQLGENSLW